MQELNSKYATYGCKRSQRIVIHKHAKYLINSNFLIKPVQEFLLPTTTSEYNHHIKQCMLHQSADAKQLQ